MLSFNFIFGQYYDINHEWLIQIGEKKNWAGKKCMTFSCYFLKYFVLCVRMVALAHAFAYARAQTHYRTAEVCRKIMALAFPLAELEPRVDSVLRLCTTIRPWGVKKNLGHFHSIFFLAFFHIDFLGRRRPIVNYDRSSMLQKQSQIGKNQTVSGAAMCIGWVYSRYIQYSGIHSYYIILYWGGWLSRN